MGPLLLLRTRGRHSGLSRTIPVVILRHSDEQWLVAPFGATHWVHNARATDRAELGRGRRFRTVQLVEIDDERTPEILYRYRRAFGLVPFVRRAFTATPADGPSAFRAEAEQHPVFLIRAVS